MCKYFLITIYKSSLRTILDLHIVRYNILCFQLTTLADILRVFFKWTWSDQLKCKIPFWRDVIIIMIIKDNILRFRDNRDIEEWIPTCLTDFLTPHVSPQFSSLWPIAVTVLSKLVSLRSIESYSTY